MNPFAYLFERFPAPTQTFCYREAAEMARQLRTQPGTPASLGIYSIRRPEAIPEDFPPDLLKTIVWLPDTDTLRNDILLARQKGGFPGEISLALAQLTRNGDRRRLEEALWLGPHLLRRGIIHVHAHFAGMATRTAYWLKQFFGISYSFTGHANDIFCETNFPIPLSTLIREATAVITETNYSRDWLREHYPEQHDRFHRVYNGLRLSTFPAAPPPSPPPGPPHLVSIGRCVEKKGFSDFIEACRLLRDAGRDFTAAIVGGGPLESSLREQIAASRLDSHITLTGPVPQEQVRSHLARATLFALACCVEADGGMDNFPTVIAEAMGHFLPVVSTRVAGVPELVKHGVTGLLTEPRCPQAFANAIATLLDAPPGSPGSPRAMGLAGRQRIEELLPIANTTAETRRIITLGLSSRNQPGAMSEPSQRSERRSA